MDPLKGIFNNPEQLNELPEGHFSRFEKKLTKELHPGKKYILPITFSAIAASLLLLIAVNQYLITAKKPNTSACILQNEGSDEIETEHYLQGEISARMSVIDSLESKTKNPENFKNDLKDIDESLNKLKQDLKQAPGDQRVVEAIINTYLIKIETLDNIMSILQKYS